jgi:phage gp29-like protein
MVTLVDHRGDPIRTADLRAEPQTARLGHLHQEFGAHPVRGLSPAKLSRLFETAERGNLIDQARLAEDMEELDAHLYAELGKRRGAVLTVDWDLRPPADATAGEKQETARIEGMLREMDIEGLLFDLTSGILAGYACIEYDWDRSAGEWRPSFALRPHDWFQSPPAARDELRLRDNSADGEPLRPWGWLVHHHRAKSGYLARSGLLRVLAWPFLFRNLSARDFAEFLEIYGLPLRIGKYPSGANEREKATLLRAVAGIGHNAAGIMPEGMSLEIQEAATGASDPFMAMISWAERSMSKAILGGTLTAEVGTAGSFAAAQVHDEVRIDIRNADLRQISRTLTRDLVTPLWRLNTRLPRAPQWVFDVREVEDLTKLADALPKLVDSGMQVPTRWVHDRSGIPQREGDEPVLTPAAPANPLAGLTGRAPLLAALRADAVVPGLPEILADRLTAETVDPLRAWIEAIRRMAHEADSLEVLRDRLLTAYGDLPDSELREVMALAFAAADAGGRLDVASGAGALDVQD